MAFDDVILDSQLILSLNQTKIRHKGDLKYSPYLELKQNRLEKTPKHLWEAKMLLEIKSFIIMKNLSNSSLKSWNFSEYTVLCDWEIWSWEKMKLIIWKPNWNQNDIRMKGASTYPSFSGFHRIHIWAQLYSLYNDLFNH